MADDDYVPTMDDSEDEPTSSKPWLDKITESQKAFESYFKRAENIDKLYADLDRQANTSRDREFAMFWANIQVLGPSIYARPPAPVVVPRFKDRKALPRVASEMLERCAIVLFEMEDIDHVMRLIRDDLSVQARGVPWIRYEERDGKKRVCIEHKDRCDFLHEPARNWKEVGWVAGAAYMDEDDGVERFGEVFKEAAFKVRKEDKDNGAAPNVEQACVWEIWSKTENKVVWVAEGCDTVLDEGEPHLELEGFFPCPRPAYGTTQRRSLIPVPDYVFYKDQLEEINELTARIAALAEAVRVRGFYPAGAGEIGDAIDAALKSNDNRQVMVPLSGFAAFGNSSAKDTIIWLPIDMIVTTIAALVELRRQLIDDVYQITGLSDIMRGSTDANETLGAQKLKSQYGNVRIRDRQAELVRVARDITRIAVEIMAENYSSKDLLDMSQMDILTDADIKQQIKQIEQQARAQVEQALADPHIAAQAQQNPQQAQQMLAQLEQQTRAQVQELEETPTVEDIMALLKEQRLRPFVLDIETDSTIQPDEDAEKQRRAEFLTAMSTTITSLSALVTQMPGSAQFAGEVLKFALAPYRAGRELEQSVDDFIDQLGQSQQQQAEDPEAIKARAEAEKMQAETQRANAEFEMKARAEQAKIDRERQKSEAEVRVTVTELDAKLREMMAASQDRAQKHAQDMEKGALDIAKLNKQIEAIGVQIAAKAQDADIKADQAEQAANQPADAA